MGSAINWLVCVVGSVGSMGACSIGIIGVIGALRVIRLIGCNIGIACNQGIWGIGCKWGVVGGLSVIRGVIKWDAYAYLLGV